ncbi:MAG TPA: LysR family transcriptional regulator [Polyangiaceae bacterium]|nr:LysR family transcriptional regulator [Polyangiaceae bacterium]
MELTLLRSFAVLAEHLHFGRAARVLHVSQPALTKQVRRLEQELAGELFERGAHGTKLTSLGAAFLPLAIDLIRRFDYVLEEGKRQAKGDIGRLAIGFGRTTLDLVPALVTQLRNTSPNVDIRLQDMSTAEQFAALEVGAIDVGFLRLPSSLPDGYAAARVADDRMVLVTQSRVSQRRLSLADCHESPFILLDGARAPDFRAHTLQLFAKYGFQPRIVQDVSEFSTALAFVRAGMGMTLVPASLKDEPLAGLGLHPVRDREARWAVGACWRRRNANPVLRGFLKLLEGARRPL